MWGGDGPESPGQQGNRWNDPVDWSESPGPSFTTCVRGSPVDLHAYDQYGNHVGLTETGETEAKIPGTYIYLPSDEDREFMWIYTEEYLRFEIVATGAGEFDLDLGRYIQSEDKEVLVTYRDVLITANTIVTVELSPDNPDFIMAIDLDGDGTVDLYQKPHEVTIASGENEPPVADANGPYTGIKRVPVTLDASGSSDSDGIIVSYEWDLDNDGTFDDASGNVVQYIWAEAYSGNIRIKVTDDGGAIAITTTTATIIDRPPELAPIGDKTVDEGQLLTFTISATDPDGDPLTYSASNLPSGASFDPTTRTFSWTPRYDQAGTYANVHFEVSDGKLTNSEDVTITVNNVTLQAAVDIDPDTINLKSQGQFITVYIELPPDYDVSQIDISSIMLNGIVPALGHPTEVGDYDNDGIPDLMVKFDRASVQSLLSPGDNTLIITGRLLGWPNTPDFEGSDTIKAK